MEFRGKKLECYFKQIPPKFSSYFGNFVGMTHFYGVRRQMRRGRVLNILLCPRRICLKRLINSVIPIETKPNEVIKAL